ncbi:amidohydrolase family protein [Salipiger sp.]|uniref:amidohydrolase family protein n=1 Tax=Salipiger sp. TaxID=2078585 RepID=UPI003A96C0A5
MATQAQEDLPKSGRGIPPLHHWDETWLSQRHEEVLEPDLPIVDAHHHIWDRNLRLPYLPQHMLADMQSGHLVRGSVYVECSFMYRAGGDPRFAGVGEVEYVNGVAAEFASNYHGPIRPCAGIVGKVDLTLGAAAGEVLGACLARAPDRFRGVRYMTAWDASPEVRTLLHPPPPGLMLDRTFREGFAELAPLGLSFDALCYHPQLPELTNLVNAFPDTTFIVNHLGGLVRVGPYRANPDEVIESWARNLRALGKRPNVFLKVGAMTMRNFGFAFADHDRPASSTALAAAWKPFVEICLEAFGPFRVMFESNFPVDKTGVSYRTLWNAFKRLAADLGETEKADVFAGTAIRAYRLSENLGTAPTTD